MTTQQKQFVIGVLILLTLFLSFGFEIREERRARGVEAMLANRKIERLERLVDGAIEQVDQLEDVVATLETALAAPSPDDSARKDEHGN